jgi:ankyrin repeat protein
MKYLKPFVTILVLIFATFSFIKAQPKSAQDEIDAMLFEACEKGDLLKAKEALAKGANPNASEYDGETPLMRAALNSKFELIDLLLTAKANPVMQDDLGNTAADLMGNGTDSATIDKMKKKLTEAAAKAKIMAENLITAIAEDDTSTAAELISKGAYIDFIDKRDLSKPTPLTITVNHQNMEILKLLLSKGVRVDRHDADDGTALKYAMENNDNEAARLLLKAEADADSSDKDGSTPIMIAAFMGNLEGVKLLLEYKADLNAVTYVTKDSALHYAIAGKHPEIVPLLLKAGANPNLQNEEGGTPLILSAAAGDLASAILLLKSGANPKLKTKSGASALDYAKKGKRTTIVKVLTEGTYTNTEFKTP